MGSMKAFLDRLESAEVQHLFDGLDDLWNSRANRFNAALKDAGLPARIAHLSSICTVLYECPARYKWTLQYYLRAHGLT